jgi:hypothetical protein
MAVFSATALFPPDFRTVSAHDPFFITTQNFRLIGMSLDRRFFKKSRNRLGEISYNKKENIQNQLGGPVMVGKKQLCALIGTAALSLGIGILLTFLLSARAMIPVLAIALIVAGGSYFLCRR